MAQHFRALEPDAYREYLNDNPAAETFDLAIYYWVIDRKG